MRAAAAAVLVLMLGTFCLSHACIKEGSSLICRDFPASEVVPNFDAGFSSLLFIKKVGEINSTMFRSENLTSVTKFRLENNDVSVIADGAFGSLLSLRTLLLNENLLTEINPNWLGAPGNLAELIFTGNRVETVTEHMLDGLVNLSKLRLNRNLIRSIDLNSFKSQSQLTELDLSENMMTRLSPQVFTSLASTKIRLDGNPWDCSCGAEQFVSFLKDLQSRDLLERPTEVKCGSPPSLSGRPVLDVSVCGPSPLPGSPSVTQPGPSPPPGSPSVTQPGPSPPPGSPSVTQPGPSPPPGSPSVTQPGHHKHTSALTTTSIATGTAAPSVFKSVLTVSTRWRHSSTASSSIEPTVSPDSASTPSETVSCPSRPPTKTLCTLAAVIGILCLLLLLLLSVLAVMRRKKRSIESVPPSPPREEKKNLEEDGRSTPSPGGREDGGPEEPDGTKTRSFSLVRAKSAHAVILTSPFCPAQRNQVTFQMETESKEDLNLEEKNRTAGITIRENLTNIADMKTRCEKQEDEKLQLQSVCPNSDVVPYLSIGTQQSNQQPSEGPGRGAQGAKVMGRVSTWPPTAVQWQARCKLKEQEGATFWTTRRNEKFSSEEEKVVALPSAPDRCKTPSPSETHPQSENQDMVQDMILEQITVIPSVFEADAHSNSRLEKNQGQETTAPETSRKTQSQNLENLGPTTNMNPVQHSGEIDHKTDLKRKPKPPGAARQRPRTRAAGSKAPSGGASPDDETLLSGNEYVCMDLLHEVVQNNGRWTRDRWKQVHTNRQRR